MKLPFPENGHEWTHSALTCFFPTSLQSLRDHVLPVQDVAQNKLGSLQRKPCTNFGAVQQVQRPLKLVFPGALSALSALSEVLIQTMRLPQRSSQGKQEKTRNANSNSGAVLNAWRLDDIWPWNLSHLYVTLLHHGVVPGSQEWDSHGQPRSLFHPGESMLLATNSCANPDLIRSKFQFKVRRSSCVDPSICIPGTGFISSFRPRPSICPDVPLRAKSFPSPHSRYILHSGVVTIRSVCCLFQSFVCSGILQTPVSGVNTVNLKLRYVNFSSAVSCTKPATSSRRCTRIIETTSAKAWPYLTRKMMRKETVNMNESNVSNEHAL